MLDTQLERTRNGLLDGMVGGLEAEHEQRVTAVAGERERSFAGVEQAAVGGVKAGLGDGAHAFGGVEEALEAHAGGGAVDGARLDAHPRVGDHPERAFGAGEHAVGADTGTGAGQPP